MRKGKWTLAWDNGRRWGYMTTNLAESINSVLKKIRNLPICSMVMATYTRCNKFFVERGREVDAMINPTYTDPTLWPNPELKRNSKGRPKSNKIRIEMDIREQHNCVKNCSYCHTPSHTRKTCPNIDHAFSSCYH
uniref:Uncharacterized protein n=1 Tax=Cajanus cajan TaxID=3821 RepID=A0A151U3V0_CAJCA|nr:hypothetical protein KK1_006635 [Cajanus cajan]